MKNYYLRRIYNMEEERRRRIVEKKESEEKKREKVYERRINSEIQDNTLVHEESEGRKKTFWDMAFGPTLLVIIFFYSFLIFLSVPHMKQGTTNNE
mmetsp:Transcript_18252/g.21069  ORF Transcript_18252/g.21069 Transcript_18252/m.21069 type:complete len:96 (+) Transcript_18252:47-334(+)